MGQCSTCLYRDDCANGCLGYVRDEDVEASYDDYQELMADIERDESE